MAMNTRLKDPVRLRVLERDAGRKRLLRRTYQDGLDVSTSVQALDALRQLRHHRNGQDVIRSMVQRNSGDVVGNVELDKL